MVKIIKKNKVNLVIPGSDLEAIKLCKKRSLYENNKCFLASVNFDILSNFINKQETYQSLRKNNLPCVEFYIAKNSSDLSKCIKKFKKREFVIKPSVSIGGRDISVFRNDISKEFFSMKKKKFIIQIKIKILKQLEKNIIENIH